MLILLWPASVLLIALQSGRSVLRVHRPDTPRPSSPHPLYPPFSGIAASFVILLLLNYYTRSNGITQPPTQSPESRSNRWKGMPWAFILRYFHGFRQLFRYFASCKQIYFPLFTIHLTCYGNIFRTFSMILYLFLILNIIRICFKFKTVLKENLRSAPLRFSLLFRT